MFKNKIALRLTKYFAILLIVFAIIIGSIFTILFKDHTTNIKADDLKTYAINIADKLSEYMVGGKFNEHGMKGNFGGFGAYIRFLYDIPMSDVWVIDKNRELITWGNGNGKHKNEYTYSNLPDSANAVIEKVFKGETTFSESFSTLLDTKTITVGTPIKDKDGQILGVVLLHSPVEGINTAVKQGLFILGISIVVALLAAFLLSVLFSMFFTKPLKKMNSTALKLAEGKYTAKTGIKQNDEIGQLANTLDRLADELQIAREQSEKLEQMRRDFIANISHELRTPITVMRGSLEALNDGVITDPQKVKAYYQQMLNESKGLQLLVSDLLDLSKLQNVDFIIDFEEICLLDVIDDVVQSGKQLTSKKGLKIEVQKNDGDFRINGDFIRVRQMIMIVLDNAIKFSFKDGEIKIIAKESGDNITLSIIDGGIGIKEEDLPYIFDRFYKENSLENQNGTGLGLAIAKQIAIRHGVELSVESETGVGSEFIFTFPKAESSI